MESVNFFFTNPIGMIISMILLVVCPILVWFIYHSLFDVVYFHSDGCLKEIALCFIGGVLLESAILYLWYISIPILIIILIVAIRKKLK